jgi:hypothetical protein
MFNLQSFATNKNAESGIIGSTLTSIRALLTHLLHSPETGVVKLTVDNGQGPIPYGYIVGVVDGNKERCRKALTDNSVSARAICLDRRIGGIASLASGYFRMTGIARVSMLPNLVGLVTGQRVYVSATAGRGTNVAPGPGAPGRKVGFITDTSGYATSGTVAVLLEFDDV